MANQRKILAVAFTVPSHGPGVRKIRDVLEGHLRFIIDELNVTEAVHKRLFSKLLNYTYTHTFWHPQVLSVIPKDPAKVTVRDVQEAVSVFANTMAIHVRDVLDRPIPERFSISEIPEEQRFHIRENFNANIRDVFISELAKLSLQEFEGVIAACPIDTIVNPFAK